MPRPDVSPTTVMLIAGMLVGCYLLSYIVRQSRERRVTVPDVAAEAEARRLCPPKTCTSISVPLSIRQIPFLTGEECDAIREAATKKGMERSKVTRSDMPSSTRTSSSVFLVEADAPVVGTVFAKVAALLGEPRSRMEDMQVVKYEPGQKYDAHWDPCFDCTADNGDLRRVHTVLMYLNDDFEGGHTVFPVAGKHVVPRRGVAAVFQSMQNGKIIPQARHAAAPVAKGTKWVATVWVRDTDVK